MGVAGWVVGFDTGPAAPVSICLTFRALFCHPLSFVHVVPFSNMCPALAALDPFLPLPCTDCTPPHFCPSVLCIFIFIFLCDGSTCHAFYCGHARSNTQMLREFLAIPLVVPSRCPSPGLPRHVIISEQRGETKWCSGCCEWCSMKKKKVNVL